MDVREKLVVLLSEKCMETCKQRKGYVCSVEECKRSKEKCCGFYADHLISNGVTIQEWIPVDDRLPEDGDVVIICTNKNFVYAGELIGDTWFLDNDSWTATVTHWMPLPQPAE